MILKPSEESVHSREDLAPVAESFWRHCHILYPVRSSECRRAQEMTGCFRATPATVQHPHTNRSQSERARPTNSGDSHTDQEQVRPTQATSILFSNKCSKLPCLSTQNLSITAYTPVTAPAQGSTACDNQLVRNPGLSWVRFTPRHVSSPLVRRPNPG